MSETSSRIESYRGSSPVIGVAFAAMGGMMLSIDIPMLRLSEAEPTMMIVVRGLCQLIISILLWRVLTRVFKWRIALIGGSVGLVSIFLYAITNLYFIFAIFFTSSANVVFILAFNPMFSALLSWWLLGEKPTRVTLAAIIVTFLGVMLIVWDGVRVGTWFGDLLAFGAVASLSVALTANRAVSNPAPMLPGLGYGVSTIFILPFATLSFDTVGYWHWLLLNSILFMPLASFLLTSALHHLRASDVAMFYVLETVLAPIWIWMIFAEAPTELALIGGIIITTTIFLHGYWNIKQGRRR